MARKGNTLWELESPPVNVPGDELFKPSIRITRYSLRADGVLLKKLQVVSEDGKRYDWGWKIANRKPPENAKQILLDRGYF